MLSVLLTFVICVSCSSSATVSEPAPVPVPPASATPVGQATDAAPPAPPTPAHPTPAPPTPAPKSPVPPGPTVVEAVAGLQTGLDVVVDNDLESLHGLRVGVIANQTSQTSEGRHIIDVLHDHPLVELVAVFAPEHGVRGLAAAGEAVGDTVDPTTGTTIRSLYGSSRSPQPEDLAAIDVLVYDLQDVGARFYTYISTMGLAMAAAHDAGVEVVILDRPNPLGGVYVAGFVRTAEHVSFISQYPVPSVYGMTAGELAIMVATEGWVDGRVLTPPTVIPMAGWDRSLRWSDLDRSWVAPSPGLPTSDAAMIYPGTVLFEATTLDYGRGTDAPFTRITAPWIDTDALLSELGEQQLRGVRFVAPREGSGFEILVDDASAVDPSQLGVHLVVALQRHAVSQGEPDIIDRPATFDLLAGTTRLRTMIGAGEEPADIAAAWTDEVESFAALRAQYLMYD